MRGKGDVGLNWEGGSLLVVLGGGALVSERVGSYAGHGWSSSHTPQCSTRGTSKQS